MTRLTHDEWASLERKRAAQRGEQPQELPPGRNVPAWALVPCSEQTSEAHFQSRVVRLAQHFGWKHYHTHDSRRSPSGFPDLVLVRARGGKTLSGRLWYQKGLLYRELKTNTGVVEPEQLKWLNALMANGADAGVWRPNMWERIVEELK